jgi:hypothetical protein
VGELVDGRCEARTARVGISPLCEEVRNVCGLAVPHTLSYVGLADLWPSRVFIHIYSILVIFYLPFVVSYVRLIQKLKYDEAKEFWRTFCPNFWAEHGEQMREVAQLTSADQLQEETFVRDHPFM